jgi:hypothetical protein
MFDDRSSPRVLSNFGVPPAHGVQQSSLPGHIGSDDKPHHPRLLWFEHCMIHGWQYLAEPAPYDLIHVVRTDPVRGISINSSRLTNGGPDSAYLRARTTLSGFFL